MKKFFSIFWVLLMISASSCVQKSTRQKVIYLLDVKGLKNVLSVGIRGENKPLNWNSDIKMKMGKDSIYSATVTEDSGYLFTEFKFTVNDDFELKEQPNRKVYFNKNGITVYKAKFNVMK